MFTVQKVSEVGGHQEVNFTKKRNIFYTGSVFDPVVSKMAGMASRNIFLAIHKNLKKKYFLFLAKNGFQNSRFRFFSEFPFIWHVLFKRVHSRYKSN